MLGQFTFRKVIKDRIVNIRWHEWDLTAGDPSEACETGEPDEYLNRPHCPKVAKEIGDLWQVCLKDGAVVDIEIQRTSWDYDVRVHTNSWSGEHLFLGCHPKADSERGRWIIVSETGRQWLESNVGGWVAFQEVPVLTVEE
ncbi:MAG: hypothetical protein NT069_31490 [Planctomycetota bacterium]|nr:hypothetical protein [Planctomycetota bacterium]